MAGYYTFPRIPPDPRKSFPTDDQDLPHEERQRLYERYIRAQRKKRFPCGWNDNCGYCLTMNCKRETGPCDRWTELHREKKMNDVWDDLLPVHYDNGVRFGTAPEMIAEIKALRRALRLYGDRSRLSRAEPELQIAIDKAMQER